MRRKEREVTDIKEIREVLDSCKVCRLGIADEGALTLCRSITDTVWKMGY